MKVELGPLRQEHGRAILRWLKDPVISQNLGLRSVPTAAKTRAFIESADRDVTICARTINVDGEHVGMVVLDHIDRQVEKGRLHIYIGAKWARGQGVGKKAVALALAVAFEDLRLHKVWLTVHAKNPGAIAAYVATGFQIEGVHRDEFIIGRERVNELYMGLLAQEWQFQKRSGRARSVARAGARARSQTIDALDRGWTTLARSTIVASV